MRYTTFSFSAATVAVLLNTACSSLTRDITHDMTRPIRVDAIASGKQVNGADCSVNNDHGQVSFKSGDTVQVRRSSKDLDIICNSPEHGDARGRAVSRANAGIAGNILIGGLIGAMVDHNSGATYTYPAWVQLVFGQDLIFDQIDEKEGAPMPGRRPATTAAQ